MDEQRVDIRVRRVLFLSCPNSEYLVMVKTTEVAFGELITSVLTHDMNKDLPLATVITSVLTHDTGQTGL